MSRSGKISVELTAQQLAQVRRIVGAGEFGSASALLREAVRGFLHRRALHAGPHGASHFSQSLELRQDVAADPCERVELLFDAADAKA
jgi:Arc/MetJ-type ribon-helix-helix transcriptional regulator